MLATVEGEPHACGKRVLCAMGGVSQVVSRLLLCDVLRAWLCLPMLGLDSWRNLAMITLALDTSNADHSLDDC